MKKERREYGRAGRRNEKREGGMVFTRDSEMDWFGDDLINSVLCCPGLLWCDEVW